MAEEQPRPRGRKAAAATEGRTEGPNATAPAAPGDPSPGPDTADRLRRDIDSGATGDNVAFQDPAAAPLGTDDEAAGTPNSAEQVRQARAAEVTRANEDANATAPGRGATEPGDIPLKTTRPGMMGAEELARGHDDRTYSAPSSDSTAERPRTVADLQGQPSRPMGGVWAMAAVVGLALLLALVQIF